MSDIEQCKASPGSVAVTRYKSDAPVHCAQNIMEEEVTENRILLTYAIITK